MCFINVSLKTPENISSQNSCNLRTFVDDDTYNSEMKNIKIWKIVGTL